MATELTPDERVEEAMKEVSASMIKYAVAFIMPEETDEEMIFLAPLEELTHTYSNRVH